MNPFSRESTRLGAILFCLIINGRNASASQCDLPLPGEAIAASVGREGQNSSADVLTIQIMLNQVPARMGGPAEALLTPDGLIGTQTIAAIEAFQRRQLLAVTGLIKPVGETLLRLNEVISSQPLPQRIVKVAQAEQQFWKNGNLRETDARGAARVKLYWATVGQDYTVDQLQESSFQNRHPWSAVFVSWVMQRAGAGKKFRYSAAHRVYTAAAKRNTIEGSDKTFKAFRVREKAPRVGGIVVKGRGGSQVSYDNVDNGEQHKTHGDIVVKIDERQAIAIGGNVSNSVRATTIPLNIDGMLNASVFFAVIIVDGQ
ncbi:MAG: DUF2272 domain-containing protein [Pirellulales bacterium]|nr:DUF2272 domain-containing protein [Pirellulales bacterium]